MTGMLRSMIGRTGKLGSSDMAKRRLWMGTWIAITLLWVLYWSRLGLALGLEGLREMITVLPGPLLFAALCLSVPATLYLLGHLLATLSGCRACQGGTTGTTPS